ncbi:MarR family winged helix-turn-helix transcriptional regulator [Paracoccus sp. pheM1]|uniref:MarR family winged helix-turn-helix transcriptional regulator n=1 Tax=Paracoccus sp. pheM1 TaxID=2831675 RepID=UPI001BDB92AC|nr:MarR family winged helix-turn-helix transcriptional regulator [Paracoccus sp. pheM1]MBT0781741.1 MarR family winged helix-turn-helix transcriptional regulator [Paracoccus sp. pheM1]
MTFRLDAFLPYRLSVAAAQVSRRFAALYEVEAGLTIPEWRVLAHLDHSGAVSIRDIHARVNLDKSVVSRAASRLQGAGLVRKSGNDADRRLIVLELTPQGQALMLRLGRIAEAFQADLLAELGPDAAALDRLLSRLAGKETGAA